MCQHARACLAIRGPRCRVARRCMHEAAAARSRTAATDVRSAPLPRSVVTVRAPPCSFVCPNYCEGETIVWVLPRNSVGEGASPFPAPLSAHCCCCRCAREVVHGTRRVPPPRPLGTVPGVRAPPRVSCSDPTVTRYMIPSLVPSGVLSVRFSLARSGRGKM